MVLPAGLGACRRADRHRGRGRQRVGGEVSRGHRHADVGRSAVERPALGLRTVEVVELQPHPSGGVTHGGGVRGGGVQGGGV
eukprot:scaffold89752_cov37-Phaeocystis_antarctica.AAC.1